MAKQFNFRRFYELQTNSVTQKGFHIHHLDFNRDHNDIRNLVRLPKELHLKYHRLVDNYLFSLGQFDVNNVTVLDNMNYFDFEMTFYKDFIQYLKKLIDCKIEISKYINERNILLINNNIIKQEDFA